MNAKRLFAFSLFALPFFFQSVAIAKPFAAKQESGILFEAERCKNLRTDSWRVVRFKKADNLKAYPSGGGLLEAASADVASAVGVVAKKPKGGKYRAWVRFALPQQTDVEVDPCSVTFKQKGKTFPVVSLDVPSTFLEEDLRTAKDMYVWKEYGVVEIADGEPLSVVFSQDSSDAFDSVCASFDCVYLSENVENTKPPKESVVPRNLYLRFIVEEDGSPMKLSILGHDWQWKSWIRGTAGTRRAKKNGTFETIPTLSGAKSDWLNLSLASDFANWGFMTEIAPDPVVDKMGNHGLLHYKVQLASAPDEKAVFMSHEIKEAKRRPILSGILNPGGRTFEPDFVSAQETADKIATLPPARGKRPVKFPVATAVCVSTLSETVIEQELKNLAALGFNSYGLGTPIQFFIDYGPKFGFRFLDGQQFRGELCATKKDADGFVRDDPEESEKKAAAFVKVLRDNKVVVPFCSLADEPGMGFGEVTEVPRNLHDFPKFLEENGVTAEELGIPSLAEAKPARYDKASLPAMHYWSMKYYIKVFGDRFRGSTKAAATQNLRTGVNFACQAVGNILWDGADWFQFYRDGTLSYGWCEDWFNICQTYQFVGFQMAVMRAACHSVNVPYGTYCIIGNRTPWDVGAKAFTQFGRKLDGFKIFNYGPSYAGADSFDKREPALFQEVRDLNFALGAVEEAYMASEPLRGDTALLYSTTSDIWNSEKTDWFPASLYGIERSTLYMLLGQCGVRADVVYEGDLAKELKNYKSLFVTDSHIHSDNLPALVDWVKKGGVLYLGANALAFDQYNRPTKIEEKLGFKRGHFTQVGRFAGTVLSHPMPKALGQVTGYGDDIPMIYGTQEVQGNALASTADGKAAITLTSSGKGKVVQCGFFPGLSHFKRASHNSEVHFQSLSVYPDNTRKLMKNVLGKMGVKPVVKSDHPMVEAVLLVGPDRDLLVLDNWSGKPQKVVVKLRNGTAYRSAKAVRVDDAKLSGGKGEAIVSLTVGTGDFIELMK